MLFLLFQIGENRYALDARQVAGVLPLIAVTPLPGMPAAVAGVCNYRGSPVPVIDLSEMLLGRPAQRRLHTRIVLIDYPDADGGTRLIGIIAEKATATLERDVADFTSPGVSGAHVGTVASSEHGMTQRIEVQQLLSAPVRELLSRQTALA
jgi:chemotaxis-related protein WspB